MTYRTRVSQTTSSPSNDPPLGKVHFAWKEPLPALCDEGVHVVAPFKGTRYVCSESVKNVRTGVVVLMFSTGCPESAVELLGATMLAP